MKEEKKKKNTSVFSRPVSPSTMEGERAPLVAETRTKGLSCIFALFCIVDFFGVFPIVALPRPIIDCGWLGIPLAIFVMSLQMYTVFMLGKCWLIAEVVDPTIVNKNRYPYAAIAELCFGVNAARVVTFILQVTIYGGGIPNLLVSSQMLQMVGLKWTDYEFDLSFCYWMIILGVCMCPVMWLGSPKEMKCLAIFSVVVVFTVAGLTWTSMIQDEKIVPEPAQPEPSWEAVAIAFGILAFQFDIHPMILTIQVDMEKKQKLGHATVGGFAVSGGFFLVTTALANYKYGASVSRNLFEILPGGALLYVNVVLVTLQICMSMVIGGSALFQEIEDKLNIPRAFNWKRCLVRSTIVLSMVAVGEFVPRFDLIMGLIGGALTSPLMFLFPALFYLRLRSMLHRQQLQRQRHDMLEYCYDRPPPYNPYLGVKSPEGEQAYFHKNCVHDTRFGYGGADNTDELCFEPVLPSAGADRVVECGYYGDDFMRSGRTSRAADRRETTRDRPRGLGWCEKLTFASIIVMGLLAMVAATYVSLKETLRVAQITPPCFF